MAMRVPDPREVKRLADELIAAEETVHRLKGEWAALFAESKLSTQEEDNRSTLADRIVELIQSRYSETFTAATVSSILNAKPNSVGPTLSRLVSEQKIRKVGHGEYRGTTPPAYQHGLDEFTYEQESPVAVAS